jgi:hypothetical protein
MYDSKSPTSLIKKTISPLGRKLYDDPVSKARKEAAEKDKTSPRSALREKHHQQEEALKHDYVRDAKHLADRRRIVESDLRIRHPAEDLNRLGTKPREKLDEVKKEEKTLRDTYESNLATLKAKNKAELERHRG